jgi:predicted metalloprotease with PDZ domain
MSRIHRSFGRSFLFLWLVSTSISATAQQNIATSFTIQLASAKDQIVDCQMSIAVDDREVIEIAIPVWAPGFYVIENFAENMVEVSAKDDAGQSLPVEQTRANRWSIQTQGSERVTVHYRLKCSRSTMMSSSLTDDLAIINGPATYFQVVGEGPRPQHVRLVMPEGWQAYAGLDHPDDRMNEFMAPNYDVLADSPFLAVMYVLGSEFFFE